MTESDVAKYLAETARVEGWFFPIDALLFAAIDEIQKRDGVGGNLFEIGVHHGKTALFLARMLRGREVLGVCDVFGAQELNVDHSGEGSRELFEANLRRFAVDATRVRIFAKPSAELTAADTTSECRFVHIDGGHRAEDVVTDLATADRALGEDGVVAVDDAFNPSWPGVGEGLYRYMSLHPGTFSPIVIGGNKALLARPAAAERFGREWAPRIGAGEFARSDAFAFESKQWLGHDVLTACRRNWVDLDPMRAAAEHAGGWRARVLRLLSR